MDNGGVGADSILPGAPTLVLTPAQGEHYILAGDLNIRKSTVAQTETSDSDSDSPKVSRVWGNWGEYMLIPEKRKEALNELGVGDIELGVGLFATPWATQAPLFITKEMDAFSYNWGSLSNGDDTLLWANRPFSLLEKVAEKLTFEKCHLALITPDWEDRKWWKTLSNLPHRKLCFPTRTPLFYGGFRKKPLPPKKNWRTVMWLIDTRNLPQKKSLHTQTPQRGLEELKREVEKIPAVQWTHGYQGGKPSQKGKPHIPYPGESSISVKEQNTQTEFMAIQEQNENSVDPEEETEENLPRTPLATFRGGVKTFEEEKPKTKSTGGLEKVLKIKVVLATPDGARYQALALIDTGAEVSLVRKGLLPEKTFTEAQVRLRLVTATNQRIQGGTTEAKIEMEIPARNVATREKITILTPTALYLADGVEKYVILSYKWLGERDLVVNPRQHGLSVALKKTKVWIPGEAKLRQRANAVLPSQPMRICGIPEDPEQEILPSSEKPPMRVETGEREGKQKKKKPRALDLFCGRKSAAHILEQNGYQVETLDIDQKRDPSIFTDVLSWEYKKIPKGVLHHHCRKSHMHRVQPSKNKGDPT